MNNFTTPSPKNIHFDEDWSSHPAVEWITAHKNLLLGIFLGLMLFLILASQFINWRTLNAEKDFFQAQTLFTQFQNSAIQQPTENSTAAADFDQLEALLQRHPELKPKYDGGLAQSFLINGQTEQAQPIIEGIFKRTQPDHLSLYQDYTQTSLLIGHGKFEESLQRALKLKTSLDQLDEKGPPLLYIFNLIRIATLYQQASRFQEELNVWDQLQNQPQLRESLMAVNQAFKMGQATLNQYIEERKVALAATINQK